MAPVNTNEWIAAKGIYVRGLSGLTAHVTGAPGEGASISGCQVHAVGFTWAAGDSLTIDSLWRDGTFSVEGTVTDSRQRTTVDSETVIVHPYASPSVSSVQYERGSWTDGEWTELPPMAAALQKQPDTGAFGEDACTLQIDWSGRYGELPDGTYRLVQPILLPDGSEDTVYAEFTLG